MDYPSPIAVVGAGAVGCYFGGMLARAGAKVTLIGRKQHVEAIERTGLYIESAKFQEHVKVAASTNIAGASEAGLVLFCVKTQDTERTAKELLPHLPKEALVVSMQNGVDNADRIRNATGIPAVPAVVYVAASMAGPGHVKHNGRGDLVLGVSQEPNEQQQIEATAQLFENSSVPCRVSGTIDTELWTKLIINCAYNAISALGQARYGHLARNPWTRKVLEQTVVEAVAVANAAGVPIDETEMLAATIELAGPMAQAMSSTAQDIQRGKTTEIDALNGHVVVRGEEVGVPTPVNGTLHALTKLREEAGWDREAKGN